MKLSTILFALGALFVVLTYQRIPSLSALFVAGADNVADDFFVTLSCNANLEVKPCQSWSSFSKKTTRNQSFSSRVTIPCGVCVFVDDNNSIDSSISSSSISLTFEDGLDIHGKLVIPDRGGLTTTIYSTLIVVQGELVVDTTLHPVDGTALVRFVLTGQDEGQSFVPIGENSKACNNGSPCFLGKKAFVVAGGKVNIQGLPSDTPTWVNLHHAIYAEDDILEFPSIIVVEKSVEGRWAVGAEILITSHTREWDAHQVRTITGFSAHSTHCLFVQIQLDAPIRRPTTRLDSRDFAVEVALLSRNIVFESGPDSIDQHGGHFIVFKTPSVVQSIIGVEVRNFGQQGRLGRYPFHFHLSDDVTGSTVAKNTIFQSNQRCIVVHETNNLLVQENVAFDTKGHCFGLEAGSETGVKWIRNLGANTSSPDTLIPDFGVNGNETDHLPATFWITNPSNTYVGNVAAGSEGAGFWFELRLRVSRADLYPFDPKTVDIVRFKNNVAHSNAKKGFRTYPGGGYLPTREQTFEGLKAYRNEGAGVFLHNTQNVTLQGLLLADNKHIGIDIDRADAITVRDTTIIGVSDSYRNLIATQEAGGVCRFDRGFYGIELHTWKFDPETTDVTRIENVAFHGFDRSLCPIAAVPFHLDRNTRTTQFDAYTSLSGINVEDLSDVIDFCDAGDANVVDVYLTDLDGSLSSSPVGPSTLVSLDSDILTFVDPAKCTRKEPRCYSYCKTCLRSVRFEVDQLDTEKHQLKICKRDESTKCIQVAGYVRNEDTFGHRAFVAHLPPGEYNAVFLDKRGVETFPNFVETRYEAAPCPDALSDGAIRLVIPDPESGECNQLVRNGNLEKSDTEPKHWLSRFGTVKLVPKAGVAGSNALAGVELAAKTTLGQFIDSRCIKLAKGQFYELSADIKLTFINDDPWRCDSKKKSCPEIGIYTEDPQEERYSMVAVVDSDATEEGFQKAFGYVEVDEKMATATNLMVYVRANVDKRVLYVDNVSMKLIANQNKFCSNVILYSDFADENWLDVWEIDGSGLLREFQRPDRAWNPYDVALRFGDRREFSDAVYYIGWRNVELKCLAPGSSWKVVAQLQLMNKRTGLPVECDLENDCPAVRVVVKDASGERIFLQKGRYYTKSSWKTDQFNRFETFFTLPPLEEWDGEIGKIVLDIRDFPVEFDLVVGSFAMKLVS